MRRSSIVFLVGLWLAAGCGGDGGAPCPQGTWGCPCYPNHSCNYGLTCGIDGRCEGPNPCDDDTACAARHRECVVADGAAACGDCLDGFEQQDEVGGRCIPLRCVPGACSGRGTCEMVDGEVECDCETGYTGDYCEACDEAAGYHLDDTGTRCTADPCDPDPCGAAQACVPDTGQCVCPPGTCAVGSQCIDGGEVSPERGCQVCDPDRNPFGWTLRAAGEVCRESSSDCDPAEICDGQVSDCPADVLAPEGTPCGSSSETVCDHPDTCDGAGECQPNPEPGTTVCRPAQGPCDATDLCDGQGACPDAVLPAGAACDDGDDCTAGDECDGLSAAVASCTGTPYHCNDHGSCNVGDAQCTCLLGYTGGYCDTCAPGWQDHDGDGTCHLACGNPLLGGCPGEALTCDDSAGVAACLAPGFVAVPAGTFSMGTPSGQAGYQPDETQHTVTLTRPLEASVVEVTQAQWRGVAETINALYKQRYGVSLDFLGTQPSYRLCDECPVERVSWTDAVMFANFASMAAGLPACYRPKQLSGAFDLGTGCPSGVGCSSTFVGEFWELPGCTGYRLPTEAEWEYLARAGSQTPFPTTASTSGDLVDPGCAELNLDPIGWYCGNSGGQSHPVAARQANAFGLYDMSGNVWEWTADRYAASFGTDPVTDPQGPETGINRVIRGGAFNSEALHCRSAARFEAPPSERSYNIGFRLVRTLDTDGDGVGTRLDNCQGVANRDQADSNRLGVGDACLPLTTVSAGTFVMGSPDGVSCPPDDPSCGTPPPAEPHRSSDEVQHLVTLTRDYQIMVTELRGSTALQLAGRSPWAQLMMFEEFGDRQEDELRCGRDCPYRSTSPLGFAAALANSLSRSAGLPQCYALINCGQFEYGNDQLSCSVVVNNYPSVYDCPGFRFPTGAEWEHAVRAGSQSALYPVAGSDGSIQPDQSVLDPNLDLVAWYQMNSEVGYPTAQEYNGRFYDIRPVAQKAPNAWGLYDTLGNVDEVVWQRRQVYTPAPVTDPELAPTSWLTGEPLMLRGGDIANGGGDCRVAALEHYLNVNWGGVWHGLRLVRTVDADADGVPVPADNCPAAANPGQADTDGDGVGDACDNCPATANPRQGDQDDGVAVYPIAATASSAARSADEALTQDCALDQPATATCGDEGADCATAWMPANPGATPEWLALEFQPVQARGLVIREGCARGGFVTAIDLVDESNTVHADWWTGPDLADWNDARHTGPTTITIDFHRPTPFRVSRVIIHTESAGNEQIDVAYLLAADGVGDACDAAPADPRQF